MAQTSVSALHQGIRPEGLLTETQAAQALGCNTVKIHPIDDPKHGRITIAPTKPKSATAAVRCELRARSTAVEIERVKLSEHRLSEHRAKLAEQPSAIPTPIGKLAEIL